MGSMCCTAEPTMAMENEDAFATPEDPLRNKFGAGRSCSKSAEADALSASDGGLGSSTEADDAATPAHKPDDHGDNGKNEYSTTDAAVTHEVNQANQQEPAKGSVPGTTDGAYLIYSPENEGSFFVLWRKEAVPNALIFAKPKEGIRIPPFKYRGQSEVARLLHRSKKSAVEGIRQFLRTMQPFQSEVQLLEKTDPDIRVPNVVFFAHTKNDTITIGDSEGSFISLPDTDVIGLCLSGTQGEGALRSLSSNETVSLETFQQRCKQYTEHIDLVSMGPVEL